MKTIRMAASAGLVLMLAGCGPEESLNPLFTKGDAVFDRALVGSWIGEGDETLDLKFEKAGDDGYRLTTIERNKNKGKVEEAEYDAHLVKLGGYEFLDVVALDRTVSANTYSARLVQLECEYRFEPSRLRVGDGLYLELIPGEPTVDGTNLELRLTSTHWFDRIWIDGDELRLASLDGAWIQKMADHAALDISYERTGENQKDVVLTAPTEDLQRFVVDHADDEEAFPSAGKWTRAK